MNVSKDLTAASATPLILAILKESDNYGYAIIKRVKEMSNNELIWTEGMLYPVLHRLEEQGLIESYWQKSESGRQRKYYRIRPRGLEELEIQKKQWEVVIATLAKTWSEQTDS
ncbi:MAG: helix-turn-helix transcriptional regulator [Syntrophomonadaceae bacterium]|jgi:PadR family transcriptional regulator PadR|nr:helix-turn-helix transcriptional regulator [Syntrophomonadaceae bacterium]